MRKALIILTLVFSITCHAQNITYNDLISIDWKDYPFSMAEMLIEKGYEFLEKHTIDESIEPGEQTRESLYELAYIYMKELNPMGAAYVCVDEMSNGNISTKFPLVKLRFLHQNKSLYNELSDEIKLACGEPDLGFYMAPDSFAFVLDKELLGGEPVYYILVYRVSKEMIDGLKKAKEIIKELKDD